MADDRIQEDFVNCSEINDMDRSGEEIFNEVADGPATSEEFRSSSPGSTAHSRGNARSSGLAESRRIGLAARLAEILVDQGDGDLLLQQSERENDFLQWIHALDMQVTGACRADERLKPLLRTNMSSVVAEDRVLARLSQLFDTAEIGRLARSLCVPLVSVRVGKVIKEGTTLYPTSSRGKLIVALLPSSDLRVSFEGDNGEIERITTLSQNSECSTVTIEEIPVDKSGRSYLIRTSGIEIFYFWCAEKSKLLGIELLSKVKGFLRRKPTLASLTGITELRLERLSVELRVCLMGSNIFKPSFSCGEASNDIVQRSQFSELSTSQHCSGIQQHLENVSLPQGSLSAHLNNIQLFLAIDPTISSSLSTFSQIIDTIPLDHGTENSSECPGSTIHNSASALSFVECLGNDSLPCVSMASQQATVEVEVGSLLSPYYCWCPPCPSLSTPLSAQLPFAASVESFTSLLPVAAFPTLLPQIPSLSSVGTAVPALSLPSPLLSSWRPNQFPIFTPLMSDPIVHVPVIGVCSSGPGYMVSAGPSALSSTIPPLVIRAPDSVVDKEARETLRLLINGSSQPSHTIIGIVPFTGSRKMYGGVRGTNSIAAIGLASLFSDSNVYSNDSLDTSSGEVGVDLCRKIKAGDGKYVFDAEDGGTFSSPGEKKRD